jgi:hypothetical protein
VNKKLKSLNFKRDIQQGENVMVCIRNQCYVVATENEIPIHLKDRSPFVLKDTEIALRFPRGEVFGSGGRVKMVGAIEFQTKITPGTLSNICDPNELYTQEMEDTHRFRCVYDPELQRGLKETPKGPKEDLREKQIESMMRAIESNTFECPQLMWNLRSGESVWAYITSTRELRIYQGVATRPDTNHRHHAIIRYHRRYQRWVAQTGSEEMGSYKPSRQYGLAVYTDDFKGEAHRSYVYNALGWKVSASTASYLESKSQAPNVHVKLARELMERSHVLGHENVEILKNNLPRNSAKMVSFNTLNLAIRDAFPDVTDEHYQDVLNHLVQFIDALSKIRPNEIALLDTSRRKRSRETSIADCAPLWSAYFKITERIFAGKFLGWEEKLNIFKTEFPSGSFSGDLFSPINPAWVEHEVVVIGKKGPQIRNNPKAREGAYALMSKVLGIASPPAAISAESKTTPLTTEEKVLQRRLTNGHTNGPAVPSNGHTNGLQAAEKRVPFLGDFDTVPAAINLAPERENQAEAAHANPVPREQHHKLFPEEGKNLKKLVAPAPGARN